MLLLKLMRLGDAQQLLGKLTSYPQRPQGTFVDSHSCRCKLFLVSNFELGRCVCQCNIIFNSGTEYFFCCPHDYLKLLSQQIIKGLEGEVLVQDRRTHGVGMNLVGYVTMFLEFAFVASVVSIP